MSSTVEIIRSSFAVEAVHDAWQALQWHPNTDIDFYNLIVASLSNVLRPHVLLVTQDGIPGAILAGRIEETRMNAKIGYFGLPGPRTRVMTFLYGGIMGRVTRVEAELLIKAIAASLHDGEADMVYFNHLRTDSPLFRAAIEMPNLCCRDFFVPPQSHFRANLPECREAFLRSLNSKVRKNLRWQANRLLKTYRDEVRIGRYTRACELETMMRDVEAIAARTYQRSLGVGVGNSSEERARFRFKAEKGWLRIYILYVGDKPCAFWCGTLYRGTLHSDFMGYDPAVGHLSPGMYLLVSVIESFCRRENREVQAIDFGLGEAQYKRLLCSEEWRDASPCIFAPNIRGILCNAYRTPPLLVNRLGRVLVNGGLEAKVKSFWRGRAAKRQETVEASAHGK